MKFIKLDPYAINDIHIQIDKVLNGLGNPDPPLNLEEVRDLLKLDRQFYSSNDTGLLDEIVSKVKIGSKQIAKRPSLLVDVIKKLELKALWLPDRKRILIDNNIPELKVRHVEAHEIIHSITPHHAPFFFGDDVVTLRNFCHEKLEAEANYGSGQLLFVRDKFNDIAYDYPRNFHSIKKLKDVFGNTLTMTLWHFVEEALPNEPLFGAISQHPKYPNDKFDPNHPFRYFITSKTFSKKFINLTTSFIYSVISSYVSYNKAGPLGECEVEFLDLDGNNHIFLMETFHNSYEALTLGTYLGPKTKKII